MLLLLPRIVSSCRPDSFHLLIEVQLILRGMHVCQTLAGWNADEGAWCWIYCQRLVEIRSWLMLLIMFSISSVGMFSINRCIVAIASNVTRFCKFEPATLLNLSQRIYLNVIRVLMVELWVRLLENKIVDVLILFAILFLGVSHDPSVSSERALISIATRPIVCTSHQSLPLLGSHNLVRISWLVVPISKQGLIT